MLHQIISVRRPLAFHPPVRGVLFSFGRDVNLALSSRVNRALDRIHERETPVKFHLDHSWSCIFDVRESSRLQVSFLKVANGRGGNVAL
jgi:hypothetical protein